MARLGSLCVYCGSSTGVAPDHAAAAKALGRSAAEQGVRIVFGGGRVGLMGLVADAALEAGGKVTGVIPENLQNWEVGHDAIDDLRVVDTMHSRKQLMCEEADAFCALPGGLGTLDETFEIITWKQLGLHDKPVVLLNTAGYWDPLLALIDHQAKAGYIRRGHMALFQAVETVAEVFEVVAAAPEPNIPGLSWRA